MQLILECSCLYITFIFTDNLINFQVHICSLLSFQIKQKSYFNLLLQASTLPNLTICSLLFFWQIKRIQIANLKTSNNWMPSNWRKYRLFSTTKEKNTWICVNETLHSTQKLVLMQFRFSSIHLDRWALIPKQDYYKDYNTIPLAKKRYNKLACPIPSSFQHQQKMARGEPRTGWIL